MGFTEDFKRLVKEAAQTRFKNDTNLARSAGVAQSAVSMLNSNKRTGLQLETVGKLMDAIGAKIVLPDDTPKIPDVDGKNLTVLPVYAVAGAGPAWDDEESEPKFFIAVPMQYITKNISLLLVSGESMSPTILDNAVVGVNRDNAEVVQGDIYAVRLPYEGIVVKRLYLDHAKKCFILRSDNKNGNFPDIEISFEEGDTFIYGRVEWALQSYRKISF
ncbi:helix-turn-helix transcriptional regulator [uncultured Desulfovibrio sp.]|uniref:S24 family peptidase n=1 Tax=uncultured Desulfovibrio sp. TaxID=167968 RepID=UPI002638C2BB|nr:S24 family peptidase [uncultured Desulfovibrio sp.]